MVVITILTEAIMVLLCLHGVFKKQIKLDLYVLGVVVWICGIYLLIHVQILPQLCTIIAYLSLGTYCYLRFKKSLKDTILKLILGLSLAVLFEVVATGVVHGFRDIVPLEILMLTSSIISLVLCYLGMTTMPGILKKIQIRKKAGFFWVCTLFFIIFPSLLIGYYKNGTPIHLYAAAIMIFLWSVYICIYKLEQSQNELEKKNMELQLQRIYGDAYGELLDEVRARQHDYKNQLSAIYSMHLVANSLEELIAMQKEYGNKLMEIGKYDSILTCCENPILAGYIYYRCIACEKAGVDVSYHIQLGRVECCFPLHEIIEILGILIDNACENLIGEKETLPRIHLDLTEQTEKIIFSVSNPARYYSSEEISRLFSKGYSTKGEGRGIGLARVLELTQKQKAQIIVTNKRNEEINWIDFTVNAIKLGPSPTNGRGSP